MTEKQNFQNRGKTNRKARNTISILSQYIQKPVPRFIQSEHLDLYSNPIKKEQSDYKVS